MGRKKNSSLTDSLQEVDRLLCSGSPEGMISAGEILAEEYSRDDIIKQFGEDSQYLRAFDLSAEVQRTRIQKARRKERFKATLSYVRENRERTIRELAKAYALSELKDGSGKLRSAPYSEVKSILEKHRKKFGDYENQPLAMVYAAFSLDLEKNT